jgi:hypothetical protein
LKIHHKGRIVRAIQVIEQIHHIGCHSFKTKIEVSMKWSPARIAARDRRRVAGHEAGHVVIARHLGGQNAFGRIRPTFAKDLRSDKQWVGSAICGMDRASYKRRIMCGVAGAIAEYVLYPDPNLLPMEQWVMRGEFEDGELSQMISESDWRAFDCDPDTVSRKVVTCALRVWELLHGPLRPALLSETRRLIVASATQAAALEVSK